MIKFNKIYFNISILIFIIEVVIAKYTKGFIRHTIGDYLCVMLLYACIKSFIHMSNLKTAILVLGIAYCVEFLQLTNLKNTYPDSYKKILRLILGTSFSMGDLIAYTFGVITTLIAENAILKINNKDDKNLNKN